mmetsp:Transcript_40006/g.106047  ORF Transcript_40006/g.106047 Transcript_40006/m.106047 type:complete len:224 (-) Transcript_40006:400-1071(-)
MQGHHQCAGEIESHFVGVAEVILVDQSILCVRPFWHVGKHLCDIRDRAHDETRVCELILGRTVTNPSGACGISCGPIGGSTQITQGPSPGCIDTSGRDVVIISEILMKRAHLGSQDNRLSATISRDDLIILRLDGAFIAPSKQDLATRMDDHQISIALRGHPRLQSKIPILFPTPNCRGTCRVLHAVEVLHGYASFAAHAVARWRLGGIPGLRDQDPADGDRG